MANNETITQGTLAGLKSGGPVMTVNTISGDSITCGWFGKSGYRELELPTHMLVIVPSPGKITVAGAIA